MPSINWFNSWFIYSFSWKFQPGSSLPSGQSQESSFTKSQGMCFEPSKHFQLPDFGGTYLEIKSGGTPRVLTVSKDNERGRKERRIAQGIIACDAFSCQSEIKTCFIDDYVILQTWHAQIVFKVIVDASASSLTVNATMVSTISPIFTYGKHPCLSGCYWRFS